MKVVVQGALFLLNENGERIYLTKYSPDGPPTLVFDSWDDLCKKGKKMQKEKLGEPKISL